MRFLDPFADAAGARPLPGMELWGTTRPGSTAPVPSGRFGTGTRGSTWARSMRRPTPTTPRGPHQGGPVRGSLEDWAGKGECDQRTPDLDLGSDQ